ncbi:MAG: N-acetylglucosaminyldiphosphoundecaprenol N-acetyl-beta-D-mannosaminyltransferase [Verrucomicrobia subdivision 3 bacterium]|nr:N-acetylglucosaminyldiphosphoundecaprenol N-acetyl-beta-D-mannosaminyltransferase [Limisphaerales bacterium]MCS1413824.1 N-acetylglucosaminyldiphosphoundecaprenol N-acetyl-beta-D-mannosaminyltransferase [Limisphaerales bacterium]
MKTVEVLGTPLRVTTYDALSDFCHEEVRKASVFAVDFTNSHIVTMRRMSVEFRSMMSCFDHFIPDGMPLIWCMNRGRAQLSDQVYGPTFMRKCLERTQPDYRHFFLGGSKECLAKLEMRLRKVHPGLSVVGMRDGYFSAEEEEGIVSAINEISPDFVWVGLGTPKQQRWISRWKSKIQRGALLAVGYAFDVNAGTKPDPPLWMQRRGLGWAFRLASEPKRLAGRYLRYNSLFLFYLLWDGLRGQAIRRTVAAGVAS